MLELRPYMVNRGTLLIFPLLLLTLVCTAYNKKKKSFSHTYQEMIGSPDIWMQHRARWDMETLLLLYMNLNTSGNVSWWNTDETVNDYVQA